MFEDLQEKWWVRQQVKISLTLIVLFVVSMVKSCNQVQYAAFGVKAQAQVTRVLAPISSRRGGDKYSAVEYQFIDKNGKEQKGSFNARPGSSPAQQGAAVDVVYVSYSPGNNMLDRDRSFLFPAIFLVMLLVLGGWVWFTTKQGLEGRM